MSNDDINTAVYWDSCAFLKHLLQEPEHELCDGTILQAEDGKLIIVTSTLTIAEVLNIRGCQKIPKANRQMVERLFSEDCIEVRNVTRKTATLARELVWEKNIKPKDAIHVATALEMGMQVMNTFDDDLIKHSRKVGGKKIILQICKPMIPKPSKKPEITQGSLFNEQPGPESGNGDGGIQSGSKATTLSASKTKARLVETD